MGNDMATNLIKKTVYINEEMWECIQTFSAKFGIPAAEIMRIALALGLEALDGKEDREAREREEREAREREYDRFCKSLDERLDKQLKVSYSALAASSVFLPKILQRVVEEKGFDNFVKGFKHLDSVNLSEMFLHVGAGMAGSEGILSEGMIDAIDWGWDSAKQGVSTSEWRKGLRKQTADIVVARGGMGFPSKGLPSPRIARPLDTDKPPKRDRPDGVGSEPAADAPPKRRGRNRNRNRKQRG